MMFYTIFRLFIKTVFYVWSVTQDILGLYVMTVFVMLVFHEIQTGSCVSCSVAIVLDSLF